MQQGNSCAGHKVKGVMAIFSQELLDGCAYFAKIAKQSNDTKEVKYSNTACIFFSVSCIEAKVNELINLHKMIEQENPHPIWESISSLSKKLSLDEKWNLLALLVDATKWDNSKEPFQSFMVIQSVRNELVHYKGTPLGKDELPINKIKQLFQRFNIASTASFIGDDVSTWIEDLLSVNGLAMWVYEQVKSLHDLSQNQLLQAPSWIKQSQNSGEKFWGHNT